MSAGEACAVFPELTLPSGALALIVQPLECALEET